MFSGVLKPDGGEIRIGGKAAVIDSVAHGQDLGVAVIHQERSTVPELTVAENIMLGYEPLTAVPGVIDREALQKSAEAIWSRLGSPAPINAVVRDLGPSVQQVVDIARALAFHARIVIMDEPTATLTRQETERLFEIIRSLKRRGAAVIYISHDLEEIFEVASRVTVLRDGKLVGTLPMSEVTRPTLIRMMIGRDLDEQARPIVNEGREEILVLQDLRRGWALNGINLRVRAGEVVGIAGLVGSGRSELLRAIFGADRIDGGEMRLHGKAYAPRSPVEASAAGVGFIPEDRKLEGLVPGFSISRNLALPNHGLVSNFGFWLDRGREHALATGMVRDLRIEPPVPGWLVSRLSGGNQQKVVLGKWLARRPKLLLIDEPTHGVDVGAREEIYRVIDELARQGAGVVVVSSYLPEVLRISDRILVMREGRIVLGDSAHERQRGTPSSGGNSGLGMTSTVSADTRLRRGRLTPTVFLARYGFYVALLILMLVFTALSSNFLTVPNGLNILQQTSTIGIMAIGQTLVILAGGIDISVGSVLGLGGMVAAMVMRNPGASPLVAASAGVLAGLVVGLVNGAIITRLGIDAFITTLATLNMARGLVYILSNQYNVDVPDGSSFFFIGRGHVQLLPVSVLIFLLLFAVLYVVERRTVLGRAIHAIGGNPAAAELSGLNVRRVRMTTYAISGACAALAGVIIVSQVGLAVPYLGSGEELDTIAAAVVGGVSLSGGAGSVLVGALGSVFIGVLLNGMALINVPAIWQMVIQGIVIILAVALYAAARGRGAE